MAPNCFRGYQPAGLIFPHKVIMVLIAHKSLLFNGSDSMAVAVWMERAIGYSISSEASHGMQIAKGGLTRNPRK